MFTKIRIVGAWLVLIAGGLRLATAFYIALMDDRSQAAMLASRYLGSKSTGDVIDGTLTVIAFAVTIGILCEISRAIRRQN
jgi:hypothetical protein